MMGNGVFKMCNVCHIDRNSVVRVKSNIRLRHRVLCMVITGTL